MNPIILYENRFNDGTPVATDEATGFSVANINDLRPYTFWKAGSYGTKYITVNCASPKSADALGIIGHNLYSASATVSVESSDNGSAWTERLAGFTPTTNKAFLKLFTSASAQYWRIKIITSANPPQIGEVMLGSRMTFPYPPDAPYAPYSEEVQAETAIGKTGHILGSVIRYKPLNITARFSNISRTWVVETFKAFWDNYASDLKPFFYAVDLTVFVDYVFWVTVKDGAKYELPLSVLSLADIIILDMTGVKEI